VLSQGATQGTALKRLKGSQTLGAALVLLQWAAITSWKKVMNTELTELKKSEQSYKGRSPP